MTVDRWAGVLLFAFATMTFAAPFLPSHADYDAASPGQDIQTFFQEDLQLQTLQAWLHAGPAMLLFIAFVLLYPRLRDAGPRGPVAATTALVAAGSFMTVNAACFLMIVTAIRSSNEGFDPHTALMLYNTGWIVMVFVGAFMAPFLIAPFYFAGAEARIPSWMRITGLIVAVLSLGLVAAGAVPQAGAAMFAGLILLLVWSLVLGVTLAVQNAPTLPPTLASARVETGAKVRSRTDSP